MKIYGHDVGHMTKVAAKPIYAKTSSKTFSSGTSGQISMKLGMWHLGLQPIIICSKMTLG